MFNYVYISSTVFPHLNEIKNMYIFLIYSFPISYRIILDVHLERILSNVLKYKLFLTLEVFEFYTKENLNSHNIV